jgi:hypothetical protein
MPELTARINVTVDTFEDAVSSANPRAYCTAVPVIADINDPTSTAEGRVSISEWRIPPMTYHIIRVAGVNGQGAPDPRPVKMIFSVFDSLGNPNAYLATDFKAEQKPTNPRANVDDPHGAQNLVKIPRNGVEPANQLTVMNHFVHRTGTGVYWECYIHIVRRLDGKIGVIDPGVENTD